MLLNLYDGVKLLQLSSTHIRLWSILLATEKSLHYLYTFLRDKNKQNAPKGFLDPLYFKLGRSF